MNITIAFTRNRRLPAPEPLPQVSEPEARRLSTDFWHGIALGCIIGAGLLLFVLAGLGRVQI